MTDNTFQLVDTGSAQVESLVNFMGQLGYRPARENGGWVTDNPALKANRSLSNATAIKLHNLVGIQWGVTAQGWRFPDSDYGAPANVDILLSPVAYNMLQASKIFKQVKIQATRKGFGIQVQSFMVKPLDPIYTRVLQLAQ